MIGRPSNTVDVLSIAEVSDSYPEQWVVLEITQRDEYGFPSKGEVLLSSTDKHKLIQETKESNGDLYLFYTGRIDDEIG